MGAIGKHLYGNGHPIEIVVKNLQNGVRKVSEETLTRD